MRRIYAKPDRNAGKLREESQIPNPNVFFQPPPAKKAVGFWDLGFDTLSSGKPDVLLKTAIDSE
jgi:hypothetical protein